jgi:hypothetical protein
MNEDFVHCVLGHILFIQLFSLVTDKSYTATVLIFCGLLLLAVIFTRLEGWRQE